MCLKSLTLSAMPLSMTTLDYNFISIDLIVKAKELQTLDDLTVPQPRLKWLEKQKIDQFCPLILTSRTAEPSTGFYAGDDIPFLLQHPLILGLRQIVISNSLRRRLCTMIHPDKLTRFVGVTRVRAALQQTKYWPLTSAEVTFLFRNCEQCAEVQICLRAQTSLWYFSFLNHWNTLDLTF